MLHPITIILWDVPCTVAEDSLSLTFDDTEASFIDKWPPLAADCAGGGGLTILTSASPLLCVAWKEDGAAGGGGGGRGGCQHRSCERGCWPLEDCCCLGCCCCCCLVDCLRLLWTPARSITSLCLALKCRVKWHLLPLRPHKVHSKVRPKCCTWKKSWSKKSFFYLVFLLPLLRRQWAKGIDSFQDTEPLTFFSDASNGIEEWIFCYYCYSLLSRLMSLMLSMSTEGSSLNYLMEPKSLN